MRSDIIAFRRTGNGVNPDKLKSGGHKDKMKYIWKYIKPYTLIISFTLLLKLVAAMMDLLIPSVLAKIIDDIVPTGDKNAIYYWGAIMLVFAVISMSTNFWANFTAAHTAGKITKTIRHDLFSKISYLSSKQLDDVTAPSAVSRLTSDTYNLNQLFSRMQRIGVRGPILLVGGIIITLIMDPVLTLVLLATLPLIAALVYIVTKKSIPLYTKQQNILDRMVSVVQENITGIRVIKALSKTEYENDRYDKVNEELADSELRAGGIMAITNPTSSLILNIGLTCVVIAGAFRVNSGLTQPGKIIAFLNYFTIILNAMLGITKIFVMYSKGAASANRVSEVLTAPEDMILEDFNTIVTPNHIEFRHVNFSYNNVENNLSDINFTLKKGQTLGILGSTGSGKSTIINLLMRFYDTSSGKILIDGRNIKSIPQQELRRMFGVVFQNDFIAADTIKENISYYRGLSDEEVKRAAGFAQAEEFISAAENGFDHMAAVRGNNLSGGQKQRLLIARALAANPDILILDDASSALDYKTDAFLRHALHENFIQTTKIIIAQRISSIKGADRILVLDDGHVIGYGTHEVLLQSCEIYRSISETQMGAEKEGGVSL